VFNEIQLAMKLAVEDGLLITRFFICRYYFLTGGMLCVGAQEATSTTTDYDLRSTVLSSASDAIKTRPFLYGSINIGFVRAKTVLLVAGCNLGAVSERSDNMFDRGVRWTDGTSVATPSKRALFRTIGWILIAREQEMGWLGILAIRTTVKNCAAHLKLRKNHTKNHKILPHWELIK
jgi:hypothetical protein